MKKCLISLMVVLFTGLSCFAFSGSGSGTQADPYVITDIYKLQEMNADPNACYKLANDIDASDTINWNGGAGFEPVGPEIAPFKGSFNGNGFKITNLYIYRPTLIGVGLFGRIHEGALVTNAGLENINIFGYQYVGALVGNVFQSEVSYCWSTGIVKGEYDYQAKIGGLIGATSGLGSVVFESFSKATVQGLGGAHQVGGLSGYNGHGSIIRDCFATGDVSGYIKVGGLVGDNCYPEGGYVQYCYSTGKVTGTGGLIGYDFLRGITYNSYWDINTSGKTSSYGGVGRTTVQMMQQGTFVGWDFKNVWGIDEGSSYPYLLAFYVKPTLADLKILGPDEVVENSEQQYKAIASYDDGSEKDITDKCQCFADNCDFAGIEPNGLFYCDMALYINRTCNIYAEYKTDANEVLTAEKEIAILPMCPTGSALTFDGVDDYLEIADNPALQFNQNDSFAISFWALPVSHLSGKGGWIIGKMQDSSVTHSFTYEVAWWSSSSTFAFSISRANSTGWVSLNTTAGSVPAGKWYYVSVVYDNRDMKIYLNGKLNSTGTFPYNADNTTSTQSMALGARLINSNLEKGRFYNGQIDDVAIFNRTLTPEEVQYNMYHKLAGNENGLVGYWDFEEGQGQIAHDKSGNGNDGQLGGSGEAQISDPNWVSPGAPVICTKPALAKRNISLAMETKKDILEDLDYALKAELAANTMLLEVQRDKQFKNVWPSANIVRARMQTFLAIVQERIARSKIVVSINHLANAIEYLNAPAEETTVKPGNPKK